MVYDTTMAQECLVYCLQYLMEEVLLPFPYESFWTLLIFLFFFYSNIKEITYQMNEWLKTKKVFCLLKKNYLSVTTASVWTTMYWTPTVVSLFLAKVVLLRTYLACGHWPIYKRVQLQWSLEWYITVGQSLK